jgi:hypothetical protein
MTPLLETPTVKHPSVPKLIALADRMRASSTAPIVRIISAGSLSNRVAGCCIVGDQVNGAWVWQVWRHDFAVPAAVYAWADDADREIFSQVEKHQVAIAKGKALFYWQGRARPAVQALN